ncbi:Clavaminate synthase-like protein [Trametes coccinea BRFM310]|uniref:Clavaminate synthase-like protein n=1 Tax=Trametes coccinea (strain BRFM310) TaxID=1353009 RepID=A0A1Y2I7M5_TRAC3|nr:Clavaminate synthase-like protein [Trametes coccinea BRFM310]
MQFLHLRVLSTYSGLVPEFHPFLYALAVRECGRGRSSYDRLEEPPSYSAFLQNYLLPNKPVLIGPALVSSWSACSDWVRPDGLIDWTYLQAEYGHLTVTVADCSTREFSDQRREQVPFRDVVSLWEEGKGQNLYVKDWQLARALASTPSQLRTYSAFYTTPDIFRDDWMNAYYSAHTEDDFRFVYVGAAGTFTPLHRDVYTSYSWSTNVCGRKRWWLFPPEHTNFLLRKGGEEHLETAYDVRQVDPELYPNFSQAQPLIIEQESGQTIFVPSGWYHQVENLTDCISINHNWCNAVNLRSLYESMCAKVTEVEHALEDVQEMLSQGAENSPNPDGWQSDWIAIVQDVVEKDAGWNWATFWRMVRHALCLAMGRPCPVKADLWPPTPHDLMPRLDFITTRVEACYADFIKRPQREIDLVTGLKEVLSDIHGLLHG